tara:strand:+ start:356 stop:637 length:282 start_codon:yes stop_codon:yes gene_type:complete
LHSRDQFQRFLLWILEFRGKRFNCFIRVSAVTKRALAGTNASSISAFPVALKLMLAVANLKLNSLDCLIRSAGTDGRFYIQPACRLAAEMPVL